jgi:hypothetical protein
MSAAEKVAVLLDGAGQDAEVDLAIVVDGDYAYDGLAMAVAGQE